MKKLIFLLLFVSLISCNNNESKIRKDLNNRFVNPEIVEIRKDSANVKVSYWSLRSLELAVSEANLKIVKLLYPENGQQPTIKEYLTANSIHDSLTARLTSFESSEYTNREPCYYVKYLVPVNENKITHEEYYQINQHGELMHRSTDWKTFLYENNYNETIDKALKYYDDLFDLKMKFKQ